MSCQISFPLFLCILAILSFLRSLDSEKSSSGTPPVYNCTVPDQPKNGRFLVNGPIPLAAGMKDSIVDLNVTCDPGYKVVGEDQFFCYYGYWSVDSMPTCAPTQNVRLQNAISAPANAKTTVVSEAALKRACKVEPSLSVLYRCLITDPPGSEGTRDCGELELEGTIIQPECRQPNFYSPVELLYMYCNNGQWNYMPQCTPECGRATKESPLIVGGTLAEKGQIPWHAGIYFRRKEEQEQICGGSIISEKVVLSAAHCFWDEKYKKLPHSLYTVAVGKLYRGWADPEDIHSQNSTVKTVYLPRYFHGGALNYQYDMAVVVVEKAFIYSTYVRPVCLDFRDDFNDRQLQRGNLGKVAGWGLTTGYRGSESNVLKVLDLPYVPYEECFSITAPENINFITGVKICAGYGNGTTLCKGDSGGGLVFPAVVQGKTRYYLRGVVSTSPVTRDSTQCNLHTLTSFEPVLKHAKMIKLNWLLQRASELTEYEPASGNDVNQWQCRDGTYIDLDLQCNRVVDCPDGSDETISVCRTKQFSKGGLCPLPVNPKHGTYTVTSHQDLPGQSFPPMTLKVVCNAGSNVKDGRSEIFCFDGIWSNTMPKCVRACKLEKHESVEYRCTNTSTGVSRECGLTEPDGATAQPLCRAPAFSYPIPFSTMTCVDGDWDYIAKCIPVVTTTTESSANTTTSKKCELPPYPKDGTYTVPGEPLAVPGQRHSMTLLNVTCNPGYSIGHYSNTIFCVDGVWSSVLPECVRACKLNKHPSVEYRCLVKDADMSRECGPYEISGTVVQPICQTPNYYSPGVLSHMHCIDGSWDYVAICREECGLLAPVGQTLIIGGRLTNTADLPWNAAIYDKLTTPFTQICGGSLIRTKIVISAAHCFWSDIKKKLPASNYAVAMGKLYRPWNSDRDSSAQKSDVAEIHIPPRFQGSAANYQDDIAVLIVTTPFQYRPNVRPICINFDVTFDNYQLKSGTFGKVGGWNLKPNLKVISLPVLSIEECLTVTPEFMREYITSDKICAGFNNDTVLCRGDSGAGVAVPSMERGQERYYLRGVVSTSLHDPKDEARLGCPRSNALALTHILSHEQFLKNYTYIILYRYKYLYNII